MPINNFGSKKTTSDVRQI